jgi:hypothetical protein
MGHLRQESPLIRLLDEVADGLADLEPGPILLAECPNKFNDAGEDDLWYAVQAGFDYWEQSHFFMYETKSTVREHSSFSHTLDPQTLKDRGATVNGDCIARLRSSLRHLQTKGWRRLVGNEPLSDSYDGPDYSGLIALVIERGQRWLVLERPNITDAEIFAWDGDGFFLVGGSDRVDQSIGNRPILSFGKVEEIDVPRLGPEAQAYFLPKVRDRVASSKLAGLLWQAVTAIRELTVEPFGLLSKGSPRSHGSDNHLWRQPEAFSSHLRPREGEFRRETAGVWPKYFARLTAEPEEMSDVAKAMHAQLGLLEDSDWRGIFASTCGENPSDPCQLGLIADREIAVLVRDNAAFEVLPDALVPLGAFDYASFLQLDETLEPIREAIRQRG